MSFQKNLKFKNLFSTCLAINVFILKLLFIFFIELILTLPFKKLKKNQIREPKVHRKKKD
jgi:hypothetical protein